MNKFEKYKQLKEQFDFVYKGIHLNRVLALSIWGLANKELRFSWKQYALALLSIDVRRLKFDASRQTILSTFGRYNRKDHLELYKTVLARLDGMASYNNTFEWGWRPAFHPMLAWKIFCYVKKQLAQSSLTMGEKAKLAVLCLHYCNVIEELRCIQLKGVEKFLCQCSVLDLENLLTQYMKLRGIPTYSLQEGVYFIFKTNPPLDAVQYENFETDHLLCWGQYSADEDLSYGISKERLLVAGYPKKVVLEPLKQNTRMRNCMVLLARDSYRHTNMALLDILASSSQYRFCLKLHPSCDYSWYSQYAEAHSMNIVAKGKTINECLNKQEYDFAIAVNTTAYYEAWMRGLPCLRFADGSFDLMSGLDDVFSSQKEFDKCMSYVMDTDIEKLQSHVDEMLRYVMGIGIDKYKEILCGK